MSKAKDATEKQLISFNDIFADIINVEVFNGEQVIDPDDLVDCPARSLQYEDGRMRELERDVSKRWNNSVDLVLLNIENQTKAEKEMPLRMIGYDKRPTHTRDFSRE